MWLEETIAQALLLATFVGIVLCARQLMPRIRWFDDNTCFSSKRLLSKQNRNIKSEASLAGVGSAPIRNRTIQSKVVVGSRVVCVCCQKCGRRGVLCSPRHTWRTKLHASVSYAHRSISVSFSELTNIASHSYRADEHRLGTDTLAIHPYPPQSLGSHLMPWPPMSCLDHFWSVSYTHLTLPTILLV